MRGVCPKCSKTDLWEERIAHESIIVEGKRVFYVKIKTGCKGCMCKFVQLFRSEYVTSHILENE